MRTCFPSLFSATVGKKIGKLVRRLLKTMLNNVNFLGGLGGGGGLNKMYYGIMKTANWIKGHFLYVNQFPDIILRCVPLANLF